MRLQSMYPTGLMAPMVPIRQPPMFATMITTLHIAITALMQAMVHIRRTPIPSLIPTRITAQQAIMIHLPHHLPEVLQAYTARHPVLQRILRCLKSIPPSQVRKQHQLSALFLLWPYRWILRQPACKVPSLKQRQIRLLHRQ